MPGTPKVMQEMEGIWRGEGRGRYPPRDSTFHYLEELEVRAMPKANSWEIRSSTKHRDTGKPMHSEIGYVRCQPIDDNHGNIEFCLIHAFGVSEISHGTYHDLTITVHSEEGSLTRTNTAKTPYTTALRRHYEIQLDEGEDFNAMSGKRFIHFIFDMATTESPNLENHLEAKLYKVV